MIYECEFTDGWFAFNVDDNAIEDGTYDWQSVYPRCECGQPKYEIDNNIGYYNVDWNFLFVRIEIVIDYSFKNGEKAN